ncbi:hypothetical protein [Flavobacterium sp. CLA17]|uniref:hypothetical protein n=1 Tax=Flavobacterium sp. CLA17 TaxID=2724135 RepID=UPI001491C546|nr:hypothetical protein [Flavobacterium sp. CLA17]QSB26907.1 hypothetical protein HAV12_021495 [Flavobacterium sp. CLA17]
MKTTNKYSKTIQWLSDTASQSSINSIAGTQTERTLRKEESSLRGRKSLLFQIYELGEKKLSN